jgi:hypothetical protein
MLKEGLQISKKAICWDCANSVAKCDGFTATERKYLEMKFRKHFGEKEEMYGK